MPLWIPLTVLAAFFQNLRSALQKRLAGALPPITATYVRFSFGLPVALLILGGLALFDDAALPQPDLRFAVFCLVGGVAQVWGTRLLVGLFAYRNFAVGTTYSKTETVQTALFGIIVLGDRVTVGALAGILISLVGVMMISLAGRGVGALGLIRSLTARPALMGMASGTAYGVAAVCYRAASLSFGRDDFLMPATFTLVTVLAIQTLDMTAWLAWRHPGQIKASLHAFRASAAIGLTGALASFGWFTAMTLQNAAYVRALGQVELVFTFMASRFAFGERSRPVEWLGITLVIAGILVLLIWRQG
ncbi:MAG: DMT family transporter [Alphaproteobacteria bacterium]